MKCNPEPKRTMGGAQVRKLRSGDEAGLSHLFRTVFGQDAHADLWRWKYLENPWGDHYAYIAEADDRVVGFAGGTPWSLSVEGREHLGVQITDIMIHPD